MDKDRKGNRLKFLDKHYDTIVWTIIIFTFFAGLFYSLYLGNELNFYDEKEYFKLSNLLIKTGTYTFNGTDPTAWRPPGYPFFLTPFIYLHANIIHLRLLNYIALCASLYIISLILKKYSKFSAILGMIIFSMYPVFFYTASKLYPQTLGATLFLLIIWLLFNTTRYLMIGLLFGILTLTIPTFAFALLFTVIWVSLTKKFQYTLKIILGALIVLVPWNIRNYRTFDSIVLVSTNGGANLLLGNSRFTKPNRGVNVNVNEYMIHVDQTEVETDIWYRDQAIKYMKENKIKTIKMYILKFLNYFNYWNVLATKSQSHFWQNIILMFTYGFLVNFAILRLLIIKHYPLDSLDKYLILLYVLNGAFMAIFITRIRLRVPFDPMLVIFNAKFLAHWIQHDLLMKPLSSSRLKV